MKRFLNIVLLLVIVGIVIAGCGYAMNQKKGEAEDTTNLYEEAEQLIVEKTIYPITKEQILDGALKGMLGAINDPYSTYYTEEEAKLSRQNLSSNRVGIGIELTHTSGRFIIISAIKKTPASVAGIAPYDELVQVNGTRLDGYSMQEALKLLQGKEGEEVELVVYRPSAQKHLTFKLKREKLVNETVRTEIIDHKDGKLGYIELTIFGEATGDDFTRALKGFEKEKVQGIIVDLRDNPGGYLQASAQTLGAFFKEPKTYGYTENAQGKLTELQTKPLDTSGTLSSYLLKTPLVILQNAGSASASEVFTSALKVWGMATVIGEKSFGKGTVQETWELSNGGEIKITSFKWLTLDKQWIHYKGIEPHIEQSANPLHRIQLQWITKSFKKEDFDEQIAYVQQVLQALGYPITRTDGYYDDATAAAVSQFRENYKLVSGDEIDETFLPTFYEVYQAEKAKKENDQPLQMGMSFLFNEIHKNE